ncbi:unnamed protein product [Pylaiella littoralis]
MFTFRQACTMKTTFAAFAALMGGASAFVAPMPVHRAVRAPASSLSMANSRSIPFMPQPENLDGSMAGDVGFDPLGLSAIDIDFSEFIVPGAAVMREDGVAEKSPVDTLYWMREAELKNGRVAQLAVVGWILVDQGFRLPGSSYAAIEQSVGAHDPMVASGNMTVLLMAVFLLEMIGGAAIFGAASGSGREPGDFGLDPFNLTSNSEKKARFELSEVQHCRLAMLAFGGIATQSVLNGGAFPYTG